MSAVLPAAQEFGEAKQAGWPSLIPTAATIAALAIAAVLVLGPGSSLGRTGTAQPAARGPAVFEMRAPAASDEYVYYIVDDPAKAKLLREALGLSQRGPIRGEVLVITSAEEEMAAGRVIAQLAPIRHGLELPEARIVDLRDY
jgi:hypothetical protein